VEILAAFEPLHPSSRNGHHRLREKNIAQMSHFV
jgi:hypothetical protein